MKIGIITDTNMLDLSDKTIRKDIPFLSNTKLYLDYINSLDANASKKLVYIMPNVILEELYQHKLCNFNKSYEVFQERFSELQYGLQGIIPKNVYEKKLLKEKKEYQKNFLVIHPKLTAKSFKKVVGDSLLKTPPFDRTECGEKTDSGFKDYMIWKTICDYNFSEFSKIYFFSCDDIFDSNKDFLIEEFKKKNKETNIEIIKYDSSIKDKIPQSLNYIIEKENIPQIDTIKLYNYDFLLQDIQKIEDSIDDSPYYFTNENIKVSLNQIEWCNFSREDFNILDVSVDETNNIYEVKLSFATSSYSYVSTNDIESKKMIEGKISLFYEKRNNCLNCKEKKVSDIHFKYSVDTLGELMNLYNNVWHINLCKALTKLSSAFSSDNLEKLSNNLSAVKIYLDSLEKLNDEKDGIIEIAKKDVDKNKK